MNLERHARIIEIMENKTAVSVKELAEKLGCTEMTARRNLDELQAQGFVKREHGYAHLLRAAASTDYYEEIRENSEEKKAIAKAALGWIHPGASVCLDSGTTIQCLVEQLPDNMPLSVITPSLTAAMDLSNKKQIQVLIPGGLLHHSNRSLLIDEQALRQYHADIAFLSCRSFQLPGGTFEHSHSLITTKRALASIAKTRILLLDHTKWNVSSICNCIPLDQIDILITDSKAPAENLQKAAELGKEIWVVDTSAGQMSRFE